MNNLISTSRVFVATSRLTDYLIFGSVRSCENYQGIDVLGVYELCWPDDEFICGQFVSVFKCAVCPFD